MHPDVAGQAQVAGRPEVAGSFDALVAPHRPALLAHCYRMTGSLHDAEDALQDALLRAWRGLDAFEGRSSVRTWLFTIATNSCRRLVEQRGRRGLPVDLGPASDPSGSAPLEEGGSWLTPFPGAPPEASPPARYESRESVELAFVAALQLLPARQRAVLLLRDVLGFTAVETALALGTSVASVTSALQRARQRLAVAAPERSQQQTLRALGDAAGQALVERFLQAWVAADVDALVGLLADDVELSMPPAAGWYRGRADVRAFLLREPLAPGRRWQGRQVAANGQLACALWLDEQADAVAVLTVRDGRLGAVTAFRSPALFDAFGLPGRLPPAQR